jgi:hypothetical protein
MARTSSAEKGRPDRANCARTRAVASWPCRCTRKVHGVNTRSMHREVVVRARRVISTCSVPRPPTGADCGRIGGGRRARTRSSVSSWRRDRGEGVEQQDLYGLSIQ